MIVYRVVQIQRLVLLHSRESPPPSSSSPSAVWKKVHLGTDVAHHLCLANRCHCWPMEIRGNHGVYAWQRRWWWSKLNYVLLFFLQFKRAHDNEPHCFHCHPTILSISLPIFLSFDRQRHREKEREKNIFLLFTFLFIYIKAKKGCSDDNAVGRYTATAINITNSTTKRNEKQRQRPHMRVKNLK